ncbi:conserved hypothetical protein [Ricinus communis]|uniref:SHSP domain-containing protein n=1 Tax=Ricinus communis TaxID=3988 RepID=B9R8T0_RICCO|nr:conserved hypothetical protein [Ricinus communis]|eukprot:XP_002510723.1 increased DNA methylation 3 isoform X1 [Ricinus communis]
MDIKGNATPFRGEAKASFCDQHFLLNFIISTYIGPDVFSDSPRCSAFQRLAARLPPYTSNNLGTSFLSISQLESIYYYVLRNAHPSLILKPNLLYMYLKGSLCLPSSGSIEDHRQFTSFFPLKLHDHKKYSDNHEIVKGIVLIDDPITSYMEKEDLERFRRLSGIDGDLRIDVKEGLNYQHESRKSGEGTEQMREKELAGTMSNGNQRPSAMFQKTYRRRNCRGPTPIPTFSSNLSKQKQHNEENTSEGPSNMDGYAKMPANTPKLQDCTSKKIVLTGTARKGRTGPQVGVVDIGISRNAYFFQVALPGVRRDFCEFGCEIESSGKVHIQGTMSGGETIKKRSRVFRMKFRRLCPAGPFTLSFNLPGPVDPRLFSPNFRTDGIFEAVIIKHK